VRVYLGRSKKFKARYVVVHTMEFYHFLFSPR